jgi:hypothetical protein
LSASDHRQRRDGVTLNAAVFEVNNRLKKPLPSAGRSGRVRSREFKTAVALHQSNRLAATQGGSPAGLGFSVDTGPDEPLVALRSSFVVDLSAFAIPEIGTTRSVNDRYVCGSVIGRNNAGLTRQWPEGLQQTVAVLRFSLVISPCSVPPVVGGRELDAHPEP